MNREAAAATAGTNGPSTESRPIRQQLPPWDKHQFPSHTILHQQFTTRMAHHGFAQTSSRGDIGFASRVIGETRQTVIFEVPNHAPKRNLNAHVDIAVPRLSFVWKSRFPRGTFDYLLPSGRSLCEIDFRLELPELSPEQCEQRQ